MENKSQYLTIDCLQKFDEKLIHGPSNIVLLKNSQDVNHAQLHVLIENVKKILSERFKVRLDNIYFIFRDIGITTKLLKNPIKIFKPYSNEIPYDFFADASFTLNSIYNFTSTDNTFDLKHHITLITGENYAGKSSCIDGIFTLFLGTGATKSSNAIKHGFIRCMSKTKSIVKNVKNNKECLIINEGKQQALPSKQFHITLAKDFKYMQYLKNVYTFDITKNINKFVSKTFFKESMGDDPEKSDYEITSKQLEAITKYYENIINVSGDPETKALVKQEFEKFYVKEKPEEKIDEMFIKTLETFINKILNELNFSFYITIFEGKLSVHDIHINKSSIDKPIKISDASTMQQNIISFIFKASLLKLWTISCTGDIQSKFPIYFVDELLDGFTLDKAILLNLIKRTERWFHRIIIISNAPSIVGAIKSSFVCGHYEIVKPKLVMGLENSNNGSGSYIKLFGTKNDINMPKPANLEEKFIQESFIPHAMFKNIIVNTYTDQFKCNKCGKISQLEKLNAHLETC
jgi:hypothetical protein